MKSTSIRMAVSATMVAIAALTATSIIPGTALAVTSAIQNPQGVMALEMKEVKKLLFLMGTHQNDKISKQEFMNFMEAKFDRLDKDKNGELAVNELRGSKLDASCFSSEGK